MNVKKNTKFAPYLGLLALTPSVTYAQNDSLSLHGFSGLFNIPNAHVTQHGTGILQFSDLMRYQNEQAHNKNLIASFGLFPNVEVSGRIAWFHADTNLYIEENREPRDLSANLKIGIPYIPKEWFSVAIGEEDVGGEASFFDAKYAVISKNIGPIRFDIGYGESTEDSPLDGAFGGFEYSPLSWFSLIAEYDAKNTNAGFRLSTPDHWGNNTRLDLTVLAYSDDENNDNDSFFGLAIKFPLDGNFSKRTPHRTTPTHTQKRTLEAAPPLYASNKYFKKRKPKTQLDFEETPYSAPPSTKESTTESSLYAIYNSLVTQEFERIRVGSNTNNNIVLSVENTIFNHNELDAIGIILGIAAMNATPKQALTTLLLTNEGLQVVKITINNSEYRNFLNGKHPANGLLTVTYPTGAAQDIDWKYSTQKYSHFKPTLTFSLNTNNAIATEWGVYEYSWALDSALSIPLWKGALAHATISNEFASSEEFEKDGRFYDQRIRNKIQESTIQQTFRYKSIFNTLYIGKTQYDYNGMQNLTTINSPQGTHKATLRFGHYTHDTNDDDSKDFSLYSYRYYSDQYDVSTEITGGKFWNGDEGIRVESKFWFGDNAVSLLYKDTEAEFIGMAWNFSLSPRRDFNSKWGQIKGNNDWKYGIQTMINNETNTLSYAAAIIPKMSFETEKVYLNRDRLSPKYINANLERLRDVYFEYK